MTPNLPALQDRSKEARQALHEHLVAVFGADQPEDAAPLGRVAELTWALRGIQSALGALEDRATAELLAEAEAASFGEAQDPHVPSLVAGLDSLNPNVVDDARYDVGQLWGKLGDLEFPKWEDCHHLLYKALGPARMNRLEGRYGTMVFMLRCHHNLPGDDLKDANYSFCLDRLNELHDELAARTETAKEHVLAVGEGIKGASPSAPDPRYDQLLKRLEVVSKQLDIATDALRLAVGQRRLRQVASAWASG